jgi:hypothetical protein
MMSRERLQQEKNAILGELYDLNEERRIIGERVARAIETGNKKMSKLLPKYRALAQRASRLAEQGGDHVIVEYIKDEE